MDPPIERADGETDKDTGDKKNKKYCGSVVDPEPLIWILIFLPIRSKKHWILDPGSSTLFVTIFVENFLKNITVLRIQTPDPDPDFLPIPDPRVKKALDPQHC
jgi:hypothetical protein